MKAIKKAAPAETGSRPNKQKATPQPVWNFCVARYVLSSLSIADDNLLIAAKNQFVDIRALDVSPLHGLNPLSGFDDFIIVQ
ncbi:hypothetical protein [uncultured Pseudoflavonifractor sp.]|uniref:hypothetical protein n=1 Tax=uncultured Pseudoflavonifractor sp. TaxID=1221379 RepID=UPI0025DA579D|nr:hypothetical protein [uncultured Pseudoflavonifractor sp.]